MDLKEVEHRLIKMAKHGDSEADAIAVVKALDAVARGIGTSWLFEEVRPGCFHVTCPKCGVAYEHYAKEKALRDEYRANYKYCSMCGQKLFAVDEKSIECIRKSRKAKKEGKR